MARATQLPTPSTNPNIPGGRTVGGFLGMATQALTAAGISSAHLDSELIMAHILGLPREWLLAHGDAEIAPPQWTGLCRMLYARSQHCPLAYLTGQKEFYGRTFSVSPNVLIPRPESEQLIESLNDLLTNDHAIHSFIDVGTGSGCLAITAKLEHPDLAVYATDLSNQALATATYNAEQLGLVASNADDKTSNHVNSEKAIHFYQANLLDNLPPQAPQQFDVIMANLPYVNRAWPELSPELAYEPELALYDNTNDSLGLIKKLALQSPTHLSPHGYLILEMDRRQTDSAIEFATQHGFTVIDRKPFMIILQTS